MDIYEYLKMDHKKVAKLFKLFETSQTEKNQLETFNLIAKELIVHAISEQDTFYKALAAQAKSEVDVEHSEEEHHDILHTINEIADRKNMNAGTQKKVLELQKMVEHHVSEEEGKIFREAKKVFSDEEALILKFKMHDLKGKLLTGQISIKEFETISEHD